LYGAAAKVGDTKAPRFEGDFRVTDSRGEEAALARHMLAQLRPAKLPFVEWLATIQATA
jgi:hypothetical protein